MLKKSALQLIPIQRFSKTLECLLLLHFTCKIYVQIYINHYSCGTWIFAEGEKQALLFFLITILKDMPTETVSRFL